jgi:hypothetical protein
MLRQGAGLTTLQLLFDQLDHSQKLLGKIMVDLIQANFTPGKIKKILENKEPSPQFYNKAFGKYHANVEEGLNTSTQKQMNFAQLMQLREMGIPIPDDLMLEQSTIQEKTKLIQAIQQQQQQQQQIQQQQMQAAMEEQKARTDLAKARTIADQGLGVERMSRVYENQELGIERKAKAENEHANALLNMVKVVKEIQHMDIAELEKYIALTHQIDHAENAKQNMMANVENANQQPMQNGSVSG